MEKCTNEIVGQKRRKRTLFDRSAKSTLEKHFELEQKPSMETIGMLADSLRMNKRVVHKWFLNRRCNMKSLAASNSSNRLSTLRIPEMKNPKQISGRATIEPSVENSIVMSEIPQKIVVIEGALKDALEKRFSMEQNPSLEAMTALADSLKLRWETVRSWFYKRRSEEKQSKRFVTSKVSLRTTRLSATQIPTSDVDVNKNISSASHFTELSSGVENNEMPGCSLESSDKCMKSPAKSIRPERINTRSSAPQMITSKVADETNETSSDVGCSVSQNNNSTIVRLSGGSFRNGRPWGPLSRRRQITENEREQDHIETPETSAGVELSKKVRFAERLVKRCMKIGNEKRIEIYAIPLIRLAESSSTFERFSFGNPQSEQVEHRTVLVLGANSLSQAKFINGVINCVFDVQQGDNYRFQLVDEKETAQTNCIKVYDVNHCGGFRVPYSLTIVSGPSYGVDANCQLFRDQNVAKLLLDLLENDGRIHELDMICNVVTEIVFNRSFTSIFGQDMAGSIHNWQSFNYLDDTCSRQEVIQRFFVALSITNVKSLQLTKQVLKERMKMEVTLKGLELVVKIGRGKMKEADKAKKLIVFCESQIRQSVEDEECFIIEVRKKVNLPAGECVYNCNRCYVTCHETFIKEEHEFQGDDYESTIPGFCSVCPDQCNFGMHSNQPYRWVYVKETRSSPGAGTSQNNDPEMKWKDIKSKSQNLIKDLEKDLDENGEAMLNHFSASWRCIQRLNNIALHGNSFLTQKVFDILYNAEQQLRNLGFEDRLANLRS